MDPVTANTDTGANFNRYSYVGNNPYAYVDPDGRIRRTLARWIAKKLLPKPPSPKPTPGGAPRQQPQQQQPQPQQQQQQQQQRQQQGDRKPRQEIQASDQQLGRKFGEHRDPDRPGYRTPQEYREKANDMLNSRAAERTTFPSDALNYPGETHIREGGDLLRLDPNGNFRSMYPDP